MDLNRTINKVINKSTRSHDETLLDLTNDTVQEENLLLNETAHDREGDPVTGGMIPITDYDQLTGKPKINNVELTGNKTSSDLSLVGTAEKGQINGVASLNESGKVPSDQLPSFVDDTIEGYLYEGAFYEDAEHTELITGESGKIYVDLVSNHSYRWSGSAYVDITDPDVENSIVHSITDSQDSYPVPTNGETVKVIIGKIKKYLSDLKTDKLDKTGEGKDVIVTYANEGTDSEITSGTKLSKIIAQIAYKFANYKFGHVIKNSSGAVTQRDTLKFTGNVTVTDDSENSQTVVNVTGGGSTGVTGVKGNAESEYRTGNVNITPANVGAVASSEGEAGDTVVTFTDASADGTITSGSALKTIIGLIKYKFAHLISGHTVVDSNGSSQTARTKLKFTGSATVTDDSTNDQTIVNITGGGSSGGHTILNSSGTSMTQRTGLQFDGLNVTDDPTNDKTIVTGTPQSMIGDAWVTSHAYAVGDYCIDGNVLYKCKTAHTSSASYRPPYASYWDAVSVASQLKWVDIPSFITYNSKYHVNSTGVDKEVRKQNGSVYYYSTNILHKNASDLLSISRSVNTGLLEFGTHTLTLTRGIRLNAYIETNSSIAKPVPVVFYLGTDGKVYLYLEIENLTATYQIYNVYLFASMFIPV